VGKRNFETNSPILWNRRICTSPEIIIRSYKLKFMLHSNN
jgi:hypothetical protein